MVLNTCAVTTEATRSSRQKAKGLHRENPNAKLVLTGCFAEIEPGKAASLPGVDLVVSNQNKDLLVRTLEEELIHS